MKKVLFSLIIILFLNGCYNYKELNNYAIANCLAIDYIDNQYMISLLISNTTKTSNNNQENVQDTIYTGKGKTIYEAIKDIELISPKEIYIGHLSVVIVSEEVARNGLNQPFELLLKDPQLNKDFYVVLAKDTDAINILKSSDFSSQLLADNIKYSNNSHGTVNETNFNTLLKKLINKDVNPTMNGFSIVKDSSNYIKLDSLGYFKDDKLLGWANRDESQGINIINNTINEMYITLNCDGGKIVVQINSLKNNLKVNKQGNSIIDIKGKGVVKESTCDHNMVKSKIINKTNKGIEKYVKKAIILSQKNKTDLFGIGKLFYQNYPKQYHNIKDWDEYYSKTKFKIKTNIQIQDHNNSDMRIERMSNEKNY